MDFIIETGNGVDGATSYVDLVYADQYVEFYYPDELDWVDQTDARKQLALITATKFIDQIIDWKGNIFYTTQPLAWPRTEFKDSDGRVIKEGVIPQAIKEAVVQLAVESLKSDLYDEGVMLTSQKYGSSSETYAGPTRDGGNEVGRRVAKDLRRMGYGSSYSTMITIERA